MQGLRVGLTLAVAIALHNIPEGVAVALPIYYGTRSRAKAFWLAAFSGLAEPLAVLAVGEQRTPPAAAPLSTQMQERGCGCWSLFFCPCCF